MKAYSFFINFLKNLKKDRVFSNAATIAYFSLLSFLPLLFLITTIVGILTGSNQIVVKKVYIFISPYVPRLTYEFWQKLTGWFAKSSYPLNFFNIIILFLSSTFVFSSIDKSLRDIFSDLSIRNRSSLESLLIYSLLIVFLTFVVFLFMLTDMLIVFLKKISLHQELFFIHHLLKKATILVPMVAFLLQILSISAILSLSIGKRIPFKKLIFVSSFIILMWLLAIKAFTWYVSFIPTYNIVYGSMSIFVVFMTWNYYSALIFLVGAEILKITCNYE